MMKLNPIKCALLITAFVSTGFTTSVLAHADHVHEHALPTSVSSSNQMTMEASKLLEALSDEQLNDILYKFSDSSNRTYWTNAPVDSQARNGLPIGRLSIEQRHQLHQLLISSTSSQGY